MSVDNWIKEASEEFGVPENIIKGVIQQESGGRHYDEDGSVLGSSAGARGIMQLMPETAEGLGVDYADPRDNIRGGVKYLKQNLDKYNGDVPLALAAYNAGSGAVDQYGGIPPYEETQNYVKSIMSNIEQQGGNLFERNFNPAQDPLREAKVTPQVLPENDYGSASQWQQAKDKFLNSFYDSAMGGGMRSLYLDLAFSSHNRQDGSPQQITQEDIKFVNDMFPGDYVTQKFILMNAKNPQHLAALAQTKKEDIARQERVEHYGYGLSTAATLAGSLLSDPTVLFPAVGQEAFILKGLSRMGKLAHVVPMNRWTKYGEIAATMGTLNVADRYGAEKLAGYKDQDYTSAFVLGAALGGGLSAGVDAFRHFKDKGAQGIVASTHNMQDHVAAQATGARMPNEVRNTRPDIEALHDPNFHTELSSENLKTLIEGKKVYAINKSDLESLGKKWGADINPNAKAFYHDDGYTAIIKDNLKPGDNIEDLILHEVGVHGGMKEFVGDDVWNKILDTVTENTKNPQGIWKDAMRRSPGGGAEEVLAHYVELAGSRNNKFLGKLKGTINSKLRAAGVTKKLSDSEILDFAHRSLQREVEKAKGYITHVDGSVTMGGMRYSAPNAVNPNLVEDVIRTDKEVLQDTQGGTGKLARIGQWFEAGGFSGNLGGILRNSKVKEVAKFSNAVFHDERMREFKGSSSIPLELQKQHIMQELSVHWHSFVVARDKYIAENMKGSRYGMNGDQLRLDFNKEVMDYLNMTYGGHQGNKSKEFDAGVIQAAQAFKNLYDAVPEIGKTSASRFGYSHKNMIDLNWKPSTGELWRVFDPEQRYSAINNIFGDYESFEKGMEDYATKFADRPVLEKELLEKRQAEWDKRKAEHDVKYKGEKESPELDPRPTEVSPEELDIHIKTRAHDYAYGMADLDISNLHQIGTHDGGLSFFKQRFPMDTSGVMVTEKGIPFSFDGNLRSYDLDGITNGIINRFAGEAAFRNYFPNPNDYDEWFKEISHKHYGKGIDQNMITEAEKAKELKALEHSVAMLRGTNPPDDVKTVMQAFGGLSRKIAYSENGANMGWNQVGEAGGAIGYAGLRSVLHVIPTLSDFIRSAAKGGDHTQAINDTVRHVFGQNVAREVWKTNWSSRTWHERAGANSMLRYMDKAESVANYMGKVTTTVNMMQRLTDNMVTGARAESIADSVEWAKGKKFSALRNPFSSKKLAAAGVNQEMEAAIRADILKYTTFNSKGYMNGMNVTKWQAENPATFTKWRFLLDNQSLRTIQQATIGNTAYLTSAHGYSTFMKVLLQFKDFSMRAINGSTLRALTSREADDAIAALGSMATNTAVYAGLTLGKSYMYFHDDEKKRQEYMKKQLSPQRLASAALLRGVMTGSILGFGGDIATAVAGTESFRTTYDNSKNMFKKDRDVSDVVGDTLGQNPSFRAAEAGYRLVNAGAQALAPHQEVTKRELSNAMKAFPLQNALPMLYLTSELSKNFPDKDKKTDHWLWK